MKIVDFYFEEEVVSEKHEGIDLENKLLLKGFFEGSKLNNKLFDDEENWKKFQNIILTNLSSVKNAISVYENILCWGNVQSGKTNNIIAMAMYLLEENFDLIILLGGTNGILYEQTDKRIGEMNFNKIPGFGYLRKESIKGSNMDNFLSTGRKLLLNTMKSQSNLDNLVEGLKSTDLSGKKIAIIDDESDYGSINIGKPISKLFSQIKSLTTRIEQTKLIMVTATPYANIISSKSSDLKPQVIVKFENDDQYTGNSFFNKNSIYKDTFIEKKNLKNSTDDLSNIVICGLKWYFYSAALCEYFNGEDNYELLFNIQSDTKEHQIISSLIDNEITKIKKLMDRKFIEMYFKEQINYFYKQIRTEEKNSIFNEILLKIIKTSNLMILNSLNENVRSFKSGQLKSNIIVGGVMASRGYTFEKLITEVMINSPSNKISADTLLQRARWFGYRKTNNRYKFMSVITNDIIKNAYLEIEKLDELILSYSNSNNLIIVNENLQQELLARKFDYIKITSGDKK